MITLNHVTHLQYPTHSLYDDIAMVLRWEGPLSWTMPDMVRDVCACDTGCVGLPDNADTHLQRTSLFTCLLLS